MGKPGPQDPASRGVSDGATGLGVPASFQGYRGIGKQRIMTQGNRAAQLQLTDNLRGPVRATVKAGTTSRQTRFLLDSDNGPLGSFTFNAFYTRA